MSINITDKKVGWQSSDPLSSEHHSPKKILVPMPDFSLKGSGDFEGVDKKAPHTLLKSVFERFPLAVAALIEHPAFKTIFQSLGTNKGMTEGPLNWEWHRRVLRFAREHEEVRRVLGRRAVIELEAERHNQNVVNDIVELQRFYIQRQHENSLEQTYKIKEGAHKEQDRHLEILDHNVLIWDQRKWNLFLLRYVKEFSPTKKLQQQVMADLANPTVSQIAAAKDYVISPLEVLMEVSSKLFDQSRRQEIEETYKNWIFQLGVSREAISDSALFRKKLEKIFYQVFERNSVEGQLTKATAEVKLNHLQETRDFNLDKMFGGRSRLQDYHEKSHVDAAKEREDFSLFVDRLNTKRNVINAYQEAENLRKAEVDYKSSYSPITIEGVTDFIQKDSTKSRTQFGIIQTWVRSVDAKIEANNMQTHDAMIQTMYDNSETRKEISQRSLDHAIETDSIMRTMRARDLFHMYTLEQISDMYAATAEAAKLMIDTRQQTKDNVSQADSSNGVSKDAVKGPEAAGFSSIDKTA